MAKQLKTTELDFDKIKTNIKTFFKRQDSPFKDLDFDGSGLNQILDILAYNTHYNAVNAHMAVNESFLDSSQIRSNVVSHAKLIGFVPKSRTASTAELKLEFNAGGLTSSQTIPENTTFTGKVDGVTYTFRTPSDSAAQTPVNGKYTFNNLAIREGQNKTQRFVFNDLTNQQFIISDKNIDKDTLVVKVKENESIADSAADTYTQFQIGDDVTNTSKIFYIQENFNGNYQIEFGNNVLGAKPTVGSIIICEFVSTTGDDANGINVFSLGTFGSSFALNDPTVITTISKSAGGTERDSIDAIKFNAPLSFISKNRAVTKKDYEAIINDKFSTLIQDISVFGGQEKSPPQYGKVFIAIKPTGGELFLTAKQKKDILEHLDNKRILAITTEIVDADFTFLYFNVFVKYNNNATSKSPAQIETTVREAISDFNNSFEVFENVFRYSKFLNKIDTSDTSILNSLAQVSCYKNFVVQANNTLSSEISFGFKLLGEIDQEEPFISTTSWIISGVNYFLDDVAIDGDTDKRKLRLYRLSSANKKIISDYDVGFLYPNTGLLQINALPADVTTTIEINAKPDSYDVPSSKEQLLSIDTDKVNVYVETGAEFTEGNSIIEND
jgi:hypothetical protein|tara:strand:- start:2252 stop:4087 length:1836 start_codon:yes stop_codon:yes gene_type:complete